MTCLKCGRLPGDLVHDTFGHQGTGCWVVHPFVGEAEKLVLRFALREMSMVMKAGQKGSRLTDQHTRWNVAIDAAKTQVERMWLPVTTTGKPIGPALEAFDQYFASEYAVLA